MRVPKVIILRDDKLKIIAAYVGGKRIKQGDSSCRRVFMSDRYVLKAECPTRSHKPLPWNGHALKQNRMEAKIWKAVVGTDHEKFFAPVIAHAKDYSWLLMRRIHGRAQYTISANMSNTLRRLEKKYRFDSEGQFRVVNRRPVIYDYGFRGDM